MKTTIHATKDKGKKEFIEANLAKLDNQQPKESLCFEHLFIIKYVKRRDVPDAQK